MNQTPYCIGFSTHLMMVLISPGDSTVLWLPKVRSQHKIYCPASSHTISIRYIFRSLARVRSPIRELVQALENCMNTTSNKKLNEVKGAYEELKGVLESIQDQSTWFDDDGFTDHTNSVINRISVICPEIDSIDSYKVSTSYSEQRGMLVQAIPTKSRLKALLGRIKGTYELDEPSRETGNVFVQNQSQSQSQTLSIILDLQEKIIAEIPKHGEGTKERTFLEKVKENLPTIKDAGDILSTVLKIGSEVGLSADAIRKILGL